MKKYILISTMLVGFALLAGFSNKSLTGTGSMTTNLINGTPDIKSMSALAFGPEGVLFVGDSKSGAIFAIDLGDKTKSKNEEAIQILDVEGKIAALLGTKADMILIHDMAVNPLSQNIYLAVSRGRSKYENRWQLPNDVDDARILLKVSPQGEIDEVELKNVHYSKASLPNPVDKKKTHMWKEGLSLRVDTITDMAYTDGKLFVAGLSNEEFASTMWQIPYPFNENISATTVEIFHGAHGKYETHAPIRTFLPYNLNNKQHLLAAYLCTPLVTLAVSDLRHDQHLKGRTVAEFGSGNYPLDMILYKKEGKDYILIANSNLPFMIVDPNDVEKYKGSITEEVAGYTAGVKFEMRSGAGVLQLDKLNSQYLVALQRNLVGEMDLLSHPIERF